MATAMLFLISLRLLLFFAAASFALGWLVEFEHQ